MNFFFITSNSIFQDLEKDEFWGQQDLAKVTDENIDMMWLRYDTNRDTFLQVSELVGTHSIPIEW